MMGFRWEAQGAGPLAHTQLGAWPAALPWWHQGPSLRNPQGQGGRSTSSGGFHLWASALGTEGVLCVLRSCEKSCVNTCAPGHHHRRTVDGKPAFTHTHTPSHTHTHTHTYLLALLTSLSRRD